MIKSMYNKWNVFSGVLASRVLFSVAYNSAVISYVGPVFLVMFGK